MMCAHRSDACTDIMGISHTHYYIYIYVPSVVLCVCVCVVQPVICCAPSRIARMRTARVLSTRSRVPMCGCILCVYAVYDYDYYYSRARVTSARVAWVCVRMRVFVCVLTHSPHAFLKNWCMRYLLPKCLCCCSSI